MLKERKGEKEGNKVREKGEGKRERIQGWQVGRTWSIAGGSVDLHIHVGRVARQCPQNLSNCTPRIYTTEMHA